MEIQQSLFYAQYIQSLGWKVIRINGVNIFFRQLPFIGGLAKIQRCEKLPPSHILIPKLLSLGIKTIAIEPAHTIPLNDFQTTIDAWKKHFKIHTSPYISTKTILIDLKPKENEIFQKFSEAKRRAVRRAIKNGVIIKESKNISDLIRIKNKSAGFLGFITTHGIDKLWPIMIPHHATILLAYTPNNKIVGGILLLFWDKIAYYWVAGATKEAKKLFAPTLLVWEALKVSKKHGCALFDFVGVWDERMPKQYMDWKGFTKFKEGFGGTTRYYNLVS